MGNIFLSSGLFINVSTYLWTYLFIMDYLIYLIYSCIHCIYIYICICGTALVLRMVPLHM